MPLLPASLPTTPSMITLLQSAGRPPTLGTSTTVTVAPGTTAPCASTTVPEIDPVTAWAASVRDETAAATSITTSRPQRLRSECVIYPPRVSIGVTERRRGYSA